MQKSMFAAAAIAALSIAGAVAQPRGDNSFNNGPGPGGATQTTDPATLAAREVSLLTHLLTLTTAQQMQATTIFTASITANQALSTPKTTARTALLAAIKANDTAAITAQATALGNLEAQEIANNAKADAAFYLLLTADQKTKLDSFNNDGFGFDIHIPGGGH